MRYSANAFKMLTRIGTGTLLNSHSLSSNVPDGKFSSKIFQYHALKATGRSLTCPGSGSTEFPPAGTFLFRPLRQLWRGHRLVLALFLFSAASLVVQQCSSLLILQFLRGGFCSFSAPLARPFHALLCVALPWPGWYPPPRAFLSLAPTSHRKVASPRFIVPSWAGRDLP